MRILLVHNFYGHAGGEDRVFQSEAALLRSRGDDVFEHTAKSPEKMSWETAVTACTSAWNRTVYQELLAGIARARPDVVHFHNTFPFLTATHAAAAEARVPAVQTLHNFRLAGCINGLRFRDGEGCDRCIVGGNPIHAVRHSCYRGSRVQTAGALLVHRAVRSQHRRRPLRYIALNENAKQVFVRAGLPAASISVKGNFAPEPSCTWTPDTHQFALYVGRLSSEKGVDVAVHAWKHHMPNIPLVVVGAGPEEAELRHGADGANVTFLGVRSPAEVLQLMTRAACVVVPSRCDEMFPMVIAEAFSVGVPVIASRTPALATILRHERSALLFRTGEVAELAESVCRLVGDIALQSAISKESRREYREKMSPDSAYNALSQIYYQATALEEASEECLSQL